MVARVRSGNQLHRPTQREGGDEGMKAGAAFMEKTKEAES